MSKKECHTGFRNGDLFCYNCGSSYHIEMPQPTTMYIAMLKQFDKDHKGCAKTWEEPQPDMALSVKDRAIWWMIGMNASRGMSSESMWWVLYANGNAPLVESKRQHPHDPDDFSRCHRLLEVIPEWKERMHFMKAVSPVWKKLVENWDTLTEMYLQLVAGKKVAMYEFMKQLGC